MLVSWAFYLLAIGSSAMYQYLAIKFLDSFFRVPGATEWFEAAMPYELVAVVEPDPSWCVAVSPYRLVAIRRRKRLKVVGFGIDGIVRILDMKMLDAQYNFL